MDDLAGLDWSSSATQSKPATTTLPSNANYFPTLKPTPPTSGRSTPSLQAKASSNAASKSGTPANDSFANLVPFAGGAPAKQISLQQQQQVLQEQRAKTLGFQHAQYTGGSGVSSGASTPARALSPAIPGPGGKKGAASTHLTAGFGVPSTASNSNAKKQTVKESGADSEADLLAAFNSSAPVDRSSHFPPPQQRTFTPVNAPAEASNAYAGLDDDDPFGLGTGPAKPSVTSPPVETGDEDDVLGLLGKPVSELPRRPKSPERSAKQTENARDKAIAELVDMGFPVEKASKALGTTESGTDVQGAVGWLLNQAHSSSSTKTKSNSRKIPSPASSERDPSRSNQGRASPGNANAVSGDAAKTASELSSTFMKTANSFWKTGQKRFNKVVAEFNADADQSQPRWMREVQGSATEERTPRRSGREESDKPIANKQRSADLLDVTDEAMMLESDQGRPKPKSQPKSTPHTSSKATFERESSLAQNRASPQPIRPNRRFVEEESAQAYISPARRRKPAPKPVEDEPDLLFGGSEAPRSSATMKAAVPSLPRPSARPRATTPPRPKVAPRTIPSMSSIALQSSTAHRRKGNEAFKLGNYGEATVAYTKSLSDIPSGHPLAVLLLTNRALTNLKTGDPKAAIADAEAATQIIGPSRGQDEVIEIGGDEGAKPMGPFWGKAVMRRAEALEQLERWSEAAKAWDECVKAGVGGSQSIQARARCEKALAPKPKASAPTVVRKPSVKPKPRSAMDDLSGKASAGTGSSAEAVVRLRATNAAAEKADDEKFALADSVDARLTAWRKGKESNLRALLGSLDTVLWDGANWKKIGMSELIVPGKVKIAYMKGIAKVHPDKLARDATTEQVMISGAVFSALNEAWDKFKLENGL